MKTYFAKAALAAAFALTATMASATVITGGINGTGGPAGLAGSFHYVGAFSTSYDINQTLSVLASSTESGTFTSTGVAYSGGDWSDIYDFLGADNASYSGVTGAYTMSDGILHMTGYLWVAAPTTRTFYFSHDDAAQLIIGNQTLVSSGCCGTDSATATFTSAGYYAVDVVYANTYYYGEGGAYATLYEDGGAIVSDFVQSVAAVPEPATWAMLVLGFGMVGVSVRRRKTAAITAA